MRTLIGLGLLMLCLFSGPSYAQFDEDTFRALETHWRRAALRDARDAAETLHASLSQGECALSPMAAQTAFLLGAIGHPASGYYFWTALQIDDRLGGLSADERLIAEAFQTTPGQYARDDLYFARSVYLGDRLTDSDGCPDLELPQLQAAPLGSGSRAVGFFEFRQRQDGLILDSRPLWVYPPSEAEALAEGFVRTRHGEGLERRSVQRWVFSPCTGVRRKGRRELTRVCRPGMAVSEPVAEPLR